MREAPLLSKRVRDLCNQHGVDRYLFVALDRDGAVMIEVGTKPTEPHFCQQTNPQYVRQHHAGRVLWDRALGAIAGFRKMISGIQATTDTTDALNVESFLKTLRPPEEGQGS